MANPWFRMYAEFATDPKVQMMSEAYQRRYLMILCLRCCNDDVTLHVTEVAFQLRISDSEWEETRAVFIAKGLITEDNQPTAWDKRQYVSDSSAERVRKHREKNKQDVKRPCNVTVTPPDTDTDTDTEDLDRYAEDSLLMIKTILKLFPAMAGSYAFEFEKWREYRQGKKPVLDLKLNLMDWMKRAAGKLTEKQPALEEF